MFVPITSAMTAAHGDRPTVASVARDIASYASRSNRFC